MKRLALAVAVLGLMACSKPADQTQTPQTQTAAPPAAPAPADTTKMMADTSKMGAAPRDTMKAMGQQKGGMKKND